jgi:hypothetical protein
LSTQEEETIPHTAVIYPNRRYRNLSIEFSVGQPRTGWSSLTVLSAQPVTDANYFKNRERKTTRQRALPRASIIDVRGPLARNRNPAESIISLLKKARRDGPPHSRMLIVGDWTHQTYENFDVALKVEERESKASDTVCCYREEGFWSLSCEQIARIFELHQRVIFGSSVFEMGSL